MARISHEILTSWDQVSELGAMTHSGELARRFAPRNDGSRDSGDRREQAGDREKPPPRNPDDRSQAERRESQQKPRSGQGRTLEQQEELLERIEQMLGLPPQEVREGQQKPTSQRRPGARPVRR